MGKIGLQLYSLKELAREDFFGTIEKVAKIGYEGIEFAGFFGASSRDLKAVLDSNGVSVCGSHTGINLLTDDLDNVIQYNLEIENPYIVCPGLPDKKMRDSAEAWKRAAEMFNRIGEKCRANNIKFGYHNHAFDFEMFDGQYGFDILAQNTDPDLVFLEIDTFWLEYAGVKAPGYLEKYPDRLTLLHLKDMKSENEKTDTEIGKGIIDFENVVKLGKQYGTEWFIVEQEEFEIPRLRSVEESLVYLKTLV